MVKVLGYLVTVVGRRERGGEVGWVTGKGGECARALVADLKK